MTAVLDTGPLAAYAHRRDAYHEPSKKIMRRVLSGSYGTPVSLDLVLLEGLTLLQRRTKDARIGQIYASYFHGAHDQREPLLRMRSSGDLIEPAIENHFRYYDRGLSTVDAALVAVTQMTDGVLVTFDPGFEGIVPTVCE